jgi:hypothetical protein
MVANVMKYPNLLGLLDPEYEGSRMLLNIGNCLLGNMV